jgi:hypothetical protein
MWELTVAAVQTAETEPALPGFVAVSRAVVAAAADLLTGVQKAVVGPANVRTARDNAWDAILADRARNQAQAELSREVAQLVAARRSLSRRGPMGQRVGSSPRSRASQATR